MKIALRNFNGFTLVILFFIPLIGWGQDDKSVQLKAYSFEEQLSWKAAYYGELIVHPGAVFGLSYIIPLKEKVNKKMVLKQRYLAINTNLGFYHQLKNHRGCIGNVEIGWHFKKIRENKTTKITYKEVLFGIGAYHYRLIGDTYTSDNGNLKLIKGKGYALNPSIAFAFGRAFHDLNFYIKPNLSLIIPSGIGLRPQAILEFGVSGLFSKN